MRKPEIVGALIPLAVLVLIDTEGVYWSLEIVDGICKLTVVQSPGEVDLRKEVSDGA